MSVSLWAYDPDKCDGDVCRGDCDLCIKAYEDIEESKKTLDEIIYEVKHDA